MTQEQTFGVSRVLSKRKLKRHGHTVTLVKLECKCGDIREVQLNSLHRNRPYRCVACYLRESAEQRATWNKSRRGDR